MSSIDPILMGKILAVLGCLSAVRVALSAFANPDHLVTKILGYVVDFFSANIKH